VVDAVELTEDPIEDVCGQEVVDHDVGKRRVAGILRAALRGIGQQPFHCRPGEVETEDLRDGPCFDYGHAFSFPVIPEVDRATWRASHAHYGMAIPPLSLPGKRAQGTGPAGAESSARSARSEEAHGARAAGFHTASAAPVFRP
jgi:hypothetical protein